VGAPEREGKMERRKKDSTALDLFTLVCMILTIIAQTVMLIAHLKR
jgi:hypothetical protein